MKITGKEDLQYLEALAMNEVIRRRKLGGYNMDADGNLLMAEIVFLLIEHLGEMYKAPKKK